MLRVLGIRAYRRLFTAQVVALLGTGLCTVALGLLAYDIAGAQTGQVLGTIFAIKMIAYVLLAPVMSALLSRVDRRPILVTADLARLAAAVLLPFVGELWQIYALVFLLQAASATFTPTFQSVIPLLVPDESDYTQAQSLSRLAYDLEAVASPVLASVLLLVVPGNALFLATGAGFAASALLIVSSVARRQLEVSATAVRPFAERVAAGIRLLVGVPQLRSALVLNVAVASIGSFVLVHTVVMARDLLGGGEQLMAVLLAVMGVGSMLVALMLPRVLPRIGDRRVMMTGARLLVVAGAFVAGLLFSGAATGWTIAIAWFAIGMGWSAVQTPVARLIRREIPDEGLAAAFAAHFSLSHACWLFAYPFSGWVGAADLSLAALVLTVIAFVAVAIAAALWRGDAAFDWSAGSGPGRAGPCRLRDAAATPVG